jgi:hypothetical protein
VLLSAAAAQAASELGARLALMEPRAAINLAGTLYTTALPATYRGTHGIFYTPGPLVDRLLAMAEGTPFC